MFALVVWRSADSNSYIEGPVEPVRNIHRYRGPPQLLEGLCIQNQEERRLVLEGQKHFIILNPVDTGTSKGRVSQIR